MVRHVSRFATFAVLPLALLAAGQAPSAAKAVYGEWGIPLEDMDRTIQPGDDFYAYVNGGWMERIEIPADKAKISDAETMRDRGHADLREIAEAAKIAPPGTVERKVGDFYASFMDEAAIEAKGLDPIKPRLAAIDAIASPADLARAFGETELGFGLTPFQLYPDADSRKPSAYALFIYQSGLGMHRDCYLVDSEENRGYRTAYRNYVETMLGLAGRADAAAEADAVLALETEIARIHWPYEEARQTDKTYNPVAASDLPTVAPGFDWATFLAAAHATEAPTIVLSENTALIQLAALAGAAPLESWKAYLAFHTLNRAAPYLAKRFDDAAFAFNGNALGGTEAQPERWRRAILLLDAMMGEALGAAYVAKRFPPESKALMLDMVANMKAALAQMIDEAGWLDASTKAEALKKLAAMEVMLGYPDTWRDYSALEIRADDLVGNIERATAFDWLRRMARINGPYDRSEWFMTPPTVDAFSIFNTNQLLFPAGILQPPLFDPGADMAFNYGATGSLIGHEISHGFDDQGRQYDETGMIRDWWSEKDAAAYKVEAQKLVDQFNAYEPLPGLHIKGEATLGENIADLAGLAIAYRAYKLSLKGKEDVVLDGFTGDQRYFMGYAFGWRNKLREERLRSVLISDSHAPPYYRVNGIVRNYQPWYDAFGVTPENTMFLDPARRATLW